uniref:Uncharacterized protein n=1 Tax=Anguilla anguilla TaxID=7936 RepID=A0A0E9QKZ3_ANGAN
MLLQNTAPRNLKLLCNFSLGITFLPQCLLGCASKLSSFFFCHISCNFIAYLTCTTG